MKKLGFILLLFIFLLGACTSNNENASEEPEEDINENEEITDENPNDEIDEETEETSPNDDDENTNEENEVEEETVEAQYYVDENAAIVPLEEGTDENVVLLTIDDAPENYTLEMAETLQELDAGAIFFVNGHFLETPEQEEALRQLHEMGFMIGNHTYTHPVLSDISEEEQREEIVSVSDRVEEIIGERPKFFRAPHGVNTEFSDGLVEEEGMVRMNWTYGYDYFEPYTNAEMLSEAIITGEAPEIGEDVSLLRPGANILMHDREWTNEALEDIVNGLRENGYGMVNPHEIEVIE